MDTLGSPLVSENPTTIVFLVAVKSRNDAIICSASASSLLLRDPSGVKVDSGLLIIWRPLMCINYMPESID